MDKVKKSFTSCSGVKCDIKENLGLFFEDGRVYNYFRSNAYSYVQREDITLELAKALKDVLI